MSISRRRCIKSLKSSFRKGALYMIVETGEKGTYFRDEELQVFGPFVDQPNGRSYVLKDYFKEKKP